MWETFTSLYERLVYVPDSGMIHPGLPAEWVVISLGIMVLLVIHGLRMKADGTLVGFAFSPIQIPGMGRWFQFALRTPWVILTGRIIAAGFFLLVIYAGLFGTPIPERNIATTLTWTLWWSGVVISVFFVGSAWCAVCPWDALASWMVRRRWWKRNDASGLALRVPRIFRNIWPALLMFIVLTWLELGMGVTTSPYATALLALLMVVLATASLVIYERKAFCRYFCAVGRTLGAYGAISPVALRPLNDEACANCKTLECFHGNENIEPCPTHLVMGRLRQNTYCTSCGACAQSCPYTNVGWRLRHIGEEILHESRPHWDEAWFVLGLMALTQFHGFTMMPYWEDWMRQLAYLIGDSGQLLWSFSIGMGAAMLLPVGLYALCVKWTMIYAPPGTEFRRVFSNLAFAGLPLAFSYHLAHNLNHLVREAHGFWSVLFNPLGNDTLPLSMHELHWRHMNPLLPNDIVFTLQAFLVLFGFWLSIKIIRSRLVKQFHLPGKGTYRAFLPMLAFITTISLMNIWLLMQPMIMRM